MGMCKHIGMVIKVKPEKLKLYRELHADQHNGVRDLLSKYNISKLCIFLHKLDDGNYYLFGSYEYIGDEYEKDMARLAVEPRNIAWLSETDECQIPLNGEKGWAQMEQVYYNK
ncbi:L-rhamnose mutarotase [Paenibacillus psychroresistens]|nr:L-rhamnose mutarotase [Paenibacillus psychroresistens]